MNTASTHVVVAVLSIAGEHLADMRRELSDEQAYASDTWRKIITVARLAGRDLDGARKLAREGLAGWTPDLTGVAPGPVLDRVLPWVRDVEARWQRVVDAIG